jgi:recombination protein RecR
MLRELPTIAQLLKGLQQVPYLASKNLYRVAEYFLEQDPKKVEQFCSLLLQAKNNVQKCDDCFTWREKERSCFFCSSKKRDKSMVCVVETWQELLAIEQTKGYNGVYHVLGGVIYPLNGVGPEDLSIEPLIARIKRQQITEIILALSQTPEGEATASYIASKLKGISVTISCLARGLPVGSSLGMMDRVTVFKALSERRPF